MLAISAASTTRRKRSKQNFEGEKSSLGKGIGELECDIEAARSRVRKLESELPELRRRVGGLSRSVELARTKVEALAEQVRGYVANVGGRMAGRLSRFGVEAYAEQPPLEAQMREAQEVAQAMNANRGHVEHEKGIGR